MTRCFDTCVSLRFGLEGLLVMTANVHQTPLLTCPRRALAASHPSAQGHGRCALGLWWGVQNQLKFCTISCSIADALGVTAIDLLSAARFEPFRLVWVG